MAEQVQANRERDPDWWYIRLSLATRQGDRPAAEEAVRRLAGLGIEVRLPEYFTSMNGGAE